MEYSPQYKELPSTEHLIVIAENGKMRCAPATCLTSTTVSMQNTNHASPSKALVHSVFTSGMLFPKYLHDSLTLFKSLYKYLLQIQPSKSQSKIVTPHPHFIPLPAFSSS